MSLKSQFEQTGNFHVVWGEEPVESKHANISKSIHESKGQRRILIKFKIALMCDALVNISTQKAGIH